MASGLGTGLGIRLGGGLVITVRNIGEARRWMQRESRAGAVIATERARRQMWDEIAMDNDVDWVQRAACREAAGMRLEGAVEEARRGECNQRDAFRAGGTLGKGGARMQQVHCTERRESAAEGMTGDAHAAIRELSQGPLHSDAHRSIARRYAPGEHFSI